MLCLTKQANQEFFNFYRDTFPDSTVAIKMHLLEDHAVQWANANHVGFGLLGEQGAESIHAKFNRLALAYTRSHQRQSKELTVHSEGTFVKH